MTKQNVEEALELIAIGIAKIVGDYSENALLVNACFIAADRYKNKQNTTHLSTVQGIPLDLRLDHEIDVTFSNEELVKKYSNEVQKVILKNYIVSIVSTTDATLEDLYERLLKIIIPSITEVELEKRIRNAWTNDSMLNFFVSTDGVDLKNPKSKNMSFREAFMRYYELRIVRHSILHNNNSLSDKNHTKLQDYLNETPKERKPYALINSPMFDKERKLVLSILHILSIRQYLDRFLMFIYTSIQEIATT